jgi:hypothetical protein
MSPSGACQAVQKFTEGQVGLDSARTVLQVEFGPGSFGTNAKRSGGYLRYLWARRPEIAGGNVYRVPRCLAPCQPVSPVRPRHTAPAPPLVTFLVTRKALSRLGKGLDLRKLVAGAGFEPATSGL